MRRPAPLDGSGGLRRSIMLRGRLDRGLRGRPGLRGRANLGRNLRARQDLGGRRGADLRRRLGARQSLAGRRWVLRRGIASRGVTAQARRTHADQNNRTEHRDVLYVMMRLSVDVSIESSRGQSPDGSARPMQNNVRTPTPPSLLGSPPGPNVATRDLEDFVPNPQRGLHISLASGRRRKLQAGHLGRLLLSTPGMAMARYRQPPRSR